MKLAAAKVAPRLTPAMSESELPRLLLYEGKTRDEDEFIEINIYVDNRVDGRLDTQDVDMVTLQRVPATTEENYRRELVSEICAKRGITLVEPRL